LEALEPAFVEYSNVCGTARSAVTRPPSVCLELVNAARIQASEPFHDLRLYELILSSGDFATAVLAALRIAQIHTIARYAIMCMRLPKSDLKQMEIYRAELDSVSFPFLETAESLLADIDRAVEGSSNQTQMRNETAVARQKLLEAELCAVESLVRAAAP
jgi:hypothetical protein